jgi:hypothetical protein
MVPNDALLNVLRSRGFEFKRQADRVMLWKQRGSSKRVAVRRHGAHDEDYVRSLLKQAGMTDEDIESFIRQTKN